MATLSERLRDLENRVTALEALLEKAPVADEPSALGLPAKVESVIALRYADSTMASQMTRTVAGAMLRQGIPAERVAEIIDRHGIVID